MINLDRVQVTYSLTYSYEPDCEIETTPYTNDEDVKKRLKKLMVKYPDNNVFATVGYVICIDDNGNEL